MFLSIDNQAPGRVALLDDSGCSLTYGALSEQCRDFCALDLPRCVAFIICENTCGAMASVCACESALVVPLVLGAATEPGLLNDLMITYKPSYLFVPQRMQTQFFGESIWSVYDYVLLKTDNPPYPVHEKLAFLMTTSGSTGSPKLVRYKYGNLEANAKNAARAFAFTEDDRALCDLPIQYTMGLNVINSHLAIGATAVLTMYNLMSTEFWSLMKNAGITNFCGVPFSYEVFSRLRFEEMDLPDLRTLCVGGGKLTDKRFMQLATYAQKTGKRFCPSFGTTETSARMATLPPELALKKIGSFGRAIPEGELFLINANGEEIRETEADGELCYRGPNVTMGYGVCREDLMLGDEWRGEYRTGDIAHRDSDGCYYVIGRTGRFLKIYGLRVSLDRCEQFIRNELEVDCACVGTDDRMEIYITDTLIKAKVVPFISNKTGLQTAAFRVHVIDEIPKNESGKIRYTALKDM